MYYSPVCNLSLAGPVLLACLRHAASVHPEPGSNSQKNSYHFLKDNKYVNEQVCVIQPPYSISIPPPCKARCRWTPPHSKICSLPTWESLLSHPPSRALVERLLLFHDQLPPQQQPHPFRSPLQNFGEGLG